MRLNNKKYKLGLVLSGGGARGFAHVGVLKALNEKGIYPDIISGVSAGALVGVLYADGHSPDKILSYFTEQKMLKYLSLSIPVKGFLKPTGLARVLSQRLNANTFEELKMPLIVATTDLNNGRIKYFSSGSLQKTVLASTIIPGLIRPIQINGITYVDGGVLNNFPIQAIFKDCKKIIGVHVNPTNYVNEFSNLLRVYERSFHLTASINVRKNSSKCDLFIEPQGLEKFHITDVSKGEMIFNIGYEATKKMLENSNKLF
ncbi:MAG: patatin-like phospholipase family protein [Bacteroidota bacterium]|nr:patatin-like phospholipase family protein [Bacteroidota bacterium]